MKKIVLAAMTAALMLPISASADLYEKSFGISYQEVEDLTGYGLEFSSSKLYDLGKSGFGIGMGFGLNIAYFSADNTSSVVTSDSFSYGGDFSLLAGYNFNRFGAPLRLKGGIGYEFGQLDNLSYYGIEYIGAVAWDLSRESAVELKYVSGSPIYDTELGDFEADHSRIVLSYIIKG